MHWVQKCINYSARILIKVKSDPSSLAGYLLRNLLFLNLVSIDLLNLPCMQVKFQHQKSVFPDLWTEVFSLPQVKSLRPSHELCNLMFACQSWTHLSSLKPTWETSFLYSGLSQSWIISLKSQFACFNNHKVSPHLPPGANRLCLITPLPTPTLARPSSGRNSLYLGVP